MKKKNEKKRLVHGSYSAALTVVVAAVLVVLNLVVGRLPSELTQPDFSTARLYTLTETTEDYLAELDQEVTLHLICEGGEEDETIRRLLRRYEDVSSWISVEEVDPALYPGFTSQYTKERVTNNSVIVSAGDQNRVIPYEEMYQIGTSAATGRQVETGFDAEGLITGAIHAVIANETPVLYVLNANQERTLGEAFVSAIEKNNITIKTRNLLSQEIPEDASAILVAAPKKDYSAEETEKILTYLEEGGKALILTDYSTEAMPNLDSILTNYGLSRGEGIILEGSSDHFISYRYCLLPQVQYSSMTAKVYKDTYLLLPMSQRIQTLDTYRKSITMTPLLSTTDAAYNKADVVEMTTQEREAQDACGPFVLGMWVQEDVNQDQVTDTELVYYSTGYLLDEDYNATVSGANAQLIADTVNALAGDSSLSIAIPTKNLQVKYLGITDFAANFWTAVCVFVLPFLCILAGLILWLYRRKRA